MKTTNLVISTAIGGLLALGAAGVQAADAPAKEKCYGVAMAGQNDCAANGHSCQGQAKADKDPTEWKYVEKGKCAEMGGSATAGPKAT
jgi:uncharacterized membrane protein